MKNTATSTRRQFLKVGTAIGASLACATMLGGCASESSASSSTNFDFSLTDEEQKLFESLDQELVVEKGFQQMDLEGVKSFYHQDTACRFADADGPYMKGWEEYGPNWLAKIFSGAALEQHFVVRNAYSYRAASDVVINTMLIDNKTLLVNDQVVDSTMRLSLIWKETSEGWKVIHEHFSKWTGELADMLGYPNTGKVEIKLNNEK